MAQKSVPAKTPTPVIEARDFSYISNGGFITAVEQAENISNLACDLEHQLRVKIRQITGQRYPDPDMPPESQNEESVLGILIAEHKKTFELLQCIRQLLSEAL